MADRPLHEEDLVASLARVAAAQTPDPAFRDRLRARLLADTASAARPSNAVLPPAPSTPRRPRFNRRQLTGAALAFAAAAGAVWALVPRPRILPALPAISATLPGDAPVRLRAPSGSRVGVAIAAPGGDSLVARLELRDGAEVFYRPPVSGTAAPTLQLDSGYVRVAIPAAARAPLRVHAADQELRLEAGAEAALELTYVPRGGNNMRAVWLIPTSAASGAALTLAVLVLQGKVALSNTAGPVPPPAEGEVMVLRSDGPAQASAHRVAELEQKVLALRQENGRLAGNLARTKGVTTASVLERIGTLKRTSLAGMLAPSAIADLVTDLKGLGEEGVQTLIKLLDSTDEKERFLAANLLEQLNAPAATQALRKVALEDKDKLASMMASHALAFMDDASSVPALREIAAADKSWETRVNALWGLCKHGDRKAIADSLAIMRDEKSAPELRGALGGNLMLLHDPELLPIVDETVRQFGKMEQVGMLAVEYYKNVSTPEARSRLEAMARDTKLAEAVRKAAERALQGKAASP